MTYLKMTDGKYYNTAQLVEIDHTASPLDIDKKGAYTRLHFVGLSDTLVIRGIKDIEQFISAIENWQHSVMSLTGFLE
jgi:hypothetical protein